MTKKEQLIQQVTSGTHAIHNNGTIEQLREVIKECFPNDKMDLFTNYEFYMRHKEFPDEWDIKKTTSLPTISVKEFYTEGEGEVSIVLEKEFTLDDMNKCWVQSIKKVHDPLKEIGFTAFIKTLESEQKNEDEFVWGEEVEASSDNQHWIIGKYIAPNPNNKYLTLITKDHFIAQYQYIRKIQTKLKLTPQMIADKFNTTVDGYEIVN